VKDAPGYQLIVKPGAQREIEGLDRPMQRRVAEALARIEQNPRGQDTVKLTGTKATYRKRVGQWRIVYEIQDDTHSIFVTLVAHRRDVYR
jgi:mRNA interferase RelE/StbE